MAEEIKLVLQKHTGEKLTPVKAFGVEKATQVRSFHRSFPEYAPTPLSELQNLAQSLGIESLYVKDESRRFGLNAFKALGGSYAIGQYIADRLCLDESEMSYAQMVSREVKQKLGELTFVTATDGNHGRGIAWTAARLGQKAVVYMPKASAPERLLNIRKLGAEASITDVNYDATVRLAREHAEKYGWVLVQDTSWQGYEQIPAHIMQGYTTMAHEAVEQLQGEKPTHIFLQAGVGAMAGALTAYFTDLYGEAQKPKIIIVEPHAANCFYRTAEAADGSIHIVTGDMPSMMAGLCCGEPCGIAWQILRDHADAFVSVPDEISAEGMRLLGRPKGDDPKVISGESGAVTTGLVAELMRNPDRRALREALGLGAHARVLCFSTEGDTDQENYSRIVG